jgi:hypothetical protein
MTRAFSRRAVLTLPLLALARPAWATRSITTEGIVFEGDLTLAGTPLQLNGVGWRAVAWFLGYAAGLYLPRKAATPEQVYEQKGAKRLRMVMTLEVDAEEFVKAFHKGVDRNTPPAELPSLADRMARFDTVVRMLGKVRKKDVVDLDYYPDAGLQLIHNDRPRGNPIAGDDLYVALLRCFIGEKPVDRGLKAGLLGGPVG